MVSFIFSVVMSAIKIILIVNMIVQNGYISDYIEAMSSNHLAWKSNYSKINQGPLSISIVIMNVLYGAIACYLAFYFIKSAHILFKFLSQKDDAMS